MKYTRILLLALCCMYWPFPPLSAQNIICSPGGVENPDSITATAYFNFGASTKAIGNKYRSALVIGQNFRGDLDQGPAEQSILGFYAQYLVPPFAATVTATQGELLDRIQISWEPDPKGPASSEGFELYRDGVFLAALSNGTRNYNDFNVIAGRPYNYELYGLNSFGKGTPGHALGFQVPNGVVTGWVHTLSGSPVTDAMVTLMPMQGTSLKFEAVGQGALWVNDSIGINPMLPAIGEDWTMSFWIKTESGDNTAAIMQMAPVPLYIRALNSSSGHEGIEIATSATDPAFLTATFPDSLKNGWHHIALTYDGSADRGRLYLDGDIQDMHHMDALQQADTLFFGSYTGNEGWAGNLDELRVYHKRLDEIDLTEVLEGTASSYTPGLQYYWKFDEAQGLKSFDIVRRKQLYFCGANFDEARPNVRTAGKTNAEGYYRIESANYGTGTTFLAEPSKHFFKHKSMSLVRNRMDYDSLPNFSLTPQATLELVVNSAGPDGTQCLLSKRWDTWDFRVMLDSLNNVRCYLNGIEDPLGPLGVGFQHLAFTIDSTDTGTLINAFKNGIPFGNQMNFPSYTGNWWDSTQAWVLGARPSGMGPMNNNMGTIDNFGGLMDEFAVYDTILSLDDIQYHVDHSRDMHEKGLRVYFALDEGSGNRLYNSGSVFLPTGRNKGADWSPLAANQSSSPHVFTPNTRQVTLNPSITSVDQVDFTDRSTIPVIGYVRYANTECFARNVEILVNGESYTPNIFTDSTGRFVIDLDPGTSAELRPKLEDHQFIPAVWQVSNVSSPTAGILFNDITTRRITGQVAGGHCKKPIIVVEPPQFATNCQITISTKNKCYEKTILVDSVAGFYEFNDLPPMEFTIAVTKHNNPLIYDDFQAEGGHTIDLTEKDSLGVDFIYISPPQVQVEGFDMFTIDASLCPDLPIVIEQNVLVLLTITAYEQYGPGQNPDDRCFLDTFEVSVNNTFDQFYDFTTPLDTLLTEGEFQYFFIADHPNEFEPYEQIIEIVVDDKGRKSEPYTNKAIITGKIVGEAKFTTQLPVMPVCILRDPPGDGSYSYLEKESNVCNTISIGEDISFAYSKSGHIEIGAGGDFTVPFVGSHIYSEHTMSDFGGFTNTTTLTGSQELKYCVNNKERIATDDGDLIVGGATLLDNTTINPITGLIDTLAGNDVYLGIGFNVIFSDSKEIKFDTINCIGNINNVVTASPDTFVTNYKYSEWNIENHVIRYLDTLIQNGIDEDSINTISKKRWEDYIELNKILKKNAIYDQNISFDAGVQYEYSHNNDNTQTYTEEIKNETEILIKTMFNFEVAVGGVVNSGEGEQSYTTTFGPTLGHSLEEQNIVTTGYVFKDDDPGDNFTVDVKTDPTYKTPVFEVKAGQSSCPWEVGTAHREGVSMISIDGTKRTNVRSNEAAVFHFDLGNNSSTYEDFTYTLVAGPESNPDGAVIKINGAILDHNLLYAIAYGTTLPITITVERGPQEYSYNGLEVVLFSGCHDERCGALGFAPDFETYLYSANYLDVDFIKPCSEIDITGPLQGWVVKPDPVNPPAEDLLPISISGYDLSNDDFQGVRIQYREEGGNGAWINITQTDIPKTALGPVFYNHIWDTQGLADGNYEIRAVSACTGGGDKNGYSHIIKGRIDRTPPSLIGTPEPSDGVYHVGDEISFSFNKNINCSRTHPAINVMLFDATTNLEIPIEVTCFENKIIINPNLSNNEYFENHILRAELHDIEDLTGNTLIYEQWEFYVDRNELAWLTDSLGVTKFEDETKVASASIHNRGGYPVPFSIENVPEWVHVVPNVGTLAPNEIRPIHFSIDSTLAFGLWTDSITLHTETGQNPFFMGGDEGLPFGVRVVCRPPTWALNPAIFENSENMVLELNINGNASTDVEDMVVAYINDTLCGRANVQYIPQLDKYLAYLTIYGNPGQVLSDVHLEIWDASACLRYAVVEDGFVFQPDIVIGDPINPQVLHADDNVLRDVPMGYGWNWLSFNLAFPDPDINAALASLQHPEDDLMKARTAFSVYVPGAGWLGSLNTLGNNSMYIYRADEPDTLKMLGEVIDPATYPLPVIAGWNWIGYIPSYSLSVNGALSSLSPQTGDLIKSQSSFAQYINSDYGWIGNLKFMQPPLGYQLKLSVPGNLVYPPPNSGLLGNDDGSRNLAVEPSLDFRNEPGKNPPVSDFWVVDPTQYEYSATLIGMLKVDEENATTATMELGVFAGNQVRGSAKAIYIEPLQAYLFFLTYYANSAGDQLHYKLYDSAGGSIQDMAEQMYFTPDLHQGSIETPVPFTLPATATQEVSKLQSFDVQPNPFRTETLFRFALQEAQEVLLTISNISGKQVSNVRIDANSGMNTMVWKGRSDAGAPLAPGIYFVRLQTETGSVVRKVVLQ